MKLTTTKDREIQFIRALVVGDSGTGKTTSLGTLPEDRTLVVAADVRRGLLPLRHRNYPVLTVDTWAELREVVVAFQGGYQVDGRDISVLALDSLSGLSELCKKQIVTVDRKALIKARTDDKEDKPRGIYDEQLTQEDWGVYGIRMHSMISAVCHLPVHVIFTVLADWREDKRTGELFRAPGLNGKIALQCPALFDIVLHMAASKDAEGKDIRLWQTFNDGRIIAKDSSGVLDPFEETNWTKLFAKILKTNGNNQPKGGGK